MTNPNNHRRSHRRPSDTPSSSQTDSTASLGDILGEAIKQSRARENLPVVPTYFENRRQFLPEAESKMTRIVRYREKRSHLSLTEAKERVETMMLIEMLNQALDMRDVNMIRKWAMENIYLRLNM